MHRVEIRTAGVRFTLSVDDYRDPAGTGDDANWLRGGVEVEIRRGHRDRFDARCDVAWTTADLARFNEALSTLLEGQSGSTSLTTDEDQVELSIVLADGNGAISGRVGVHAAASLRFEGVEIERSELTRTLADLRQVVAAYPARP